MSDRSSSPPRPPRAFRCLAVLDVLALPEPAQLVEGLLPAEGLAMIYGQPGSGKTFLALDLALTLVSGGGAWLGRKLRRKGRVNYLAAEGAHSLKPRIQAWALHYGLLEAELAGLTVIPDAVQLFDLADVAAFREALQPTAPAVLTVLDTLSRCSPGVRENLQEDTSLVVHALELIREVTAGLVLTVHHTPKDREIERGSSVYRGAMDTMLSVIDDDTCRLLKVTKQRDGELGDPLRFQLVSGGGGLIVTAGEGVSTGRDPGLTNRQRDVLRALLDVCPKDGEVSAQTWGEAIEMPRRTFNRGLKILIDRGLVRRVARGLYAPTAEADSALRPRAA